MASEQTILKVLDLLTTAPAPELATRGAAVSGHATSLRRIISTKNVVAVGMSEKVSRGRRTGKLALTFYVERKVARSRLTADQFIPPAVPEALSGEEAVPTDVVVLGRLRPEVNVKRHPVEPGNSVGHVEITAGTLGAVVRKGGEVHLLSNSHVFAVSGTARKGDHVIYPGAADGGRMPEDLVATLADFVKFQVGGDFVNRVDCAVVKPTEARLADVVAEIKGLGLPKGTSKARRGMKVVKVGRTTGRTTGEVRDVNFRFTLNYPEVGDVGFLDQVLCTRYTKPGDSGSLVVDRETGRAVGLHFAGASGGSVFNPIDEVLSALGVTLVTSPLAGGPAAKKPSKKPAKKPSQKSATKAATKKPSKKSSKKSSKKGTKKSGK